MELFSSLGVLELLKSFGCGNDRAIALFDHYEARWKIHGERSLGEGGISDGHTRLD